MFKNFFLILSTLSVVNGGKSYLPLEQQELLRQSLQILALNAYWRQMQNLPLRRWSEKNRDCAGFIRYLLWEAYQKHDELWQEHEGSMLTRNLPTLQGKIPQLYPTGASAYQLVKNNTRFLGRDLRSIYLRTGDLLYFRQDKQTDHLMLVIQDRKEEIFVVYHTGKPKNEIRLVKWTDLFAHESRWYPEVGNPNFMGVFRFYFFQ